ncbi:MAG: iron-containing redox enzyme family protein [Methylotenera sp.]|uniref:TenA family transcriptional regulator n=1 Tax=Methylotenera sp. TaxID=2051956 RepID=UPI0027320956|nr:iron-containing redox enzyme family protein [Methylotenera sp.]MDP1522325.1 iron-containing redox enzyme family protein [Methylotenera sp.]
MPFYEILLSETEKEREVLFNLPLIKAGAAGQVNLPAYVAFLTEAYHHVKHTIPLLMLCGSKLPEHYEWLREAVAEYIEEELGHQEWILNDINACGTDAETVRHGQPGLSTEIMVAYAYDMINRVNPIGFFGMVLVLEGTSVALATQAGASLQSSLGLPNKAFSYLTSHGALDVGHTEFYAGLVNKIEDKKERALLIRSAKNFYKLYGDIFRELGNRFIPEHFIPSNLIPSNLIPSNLIPSNSQQVAV